MRMGPGELTATGMQISTLADRLSREVGRDVVDKTGLQGRYDFTLHWTPETPASLPGGPADGGPGPAAAPPDSSGPSIFTAIQEQLGLKLDSQKGPVKTLVIESIEKPSEN
jgi:bla regulator protein blaR1